ncbi:MAG: hypothetical protein ACYTHM_13090 [Planctomycetota bacterium]|jgi:hypothetical protein
MRIHHLYPLITILLLSLPKTLEGRERHPLLPKPQFENCMFVEVQCGEGRSREEKLAELKEFYELVGPQRLYVRVSILSDNWTGRPLTDEDYRAYGMFHAHFKTVILGHNRKGLFQNDIRTGQWLSDGTPGLKKGSGGPPFYTLSRYNDPVWNNMRADALAAGKEFKAALDRGSPVSVLAIPNELTYSFPVPQDVGAGYEPHMVAEFRDWLAHRGRYAKGGPFEGEGWPGGEPFSDDPSPAKAKGRHGSFNATFRTSFSTWTLKYWDIEKFPDPLPPGSSLTPGAGQPGFTRGGFDAPRRTSDPLLPYWQGMDHKKPSFRALAVHRALTMIQKIIHEAGVPKDRIFTRSKERWYGRYTDFGKNTPLRALVPGWTAYTPFGNPGYNLYLNGGTTDWLTGSIALNLKEAKRTTWAVTEFHPYSDHAMDHDADAYFESLKGFWEMDTAPRYIGCAKWNSVRKHQNRWRIKGTPFVEALQRFVRWLPDQPRPFEKRKKPVAYRPPPVHDLKFTEEAGTALIRWAERIWEGDIVAWPAWTEFSKFEVGTCETLDAEGNPKGVRNLGKTRENKFSVPSKRLKAVLCVRAHSRSRLKGAWSTLRVKEGENAK